LKDYGVILADKKFLKLKGWVYAYISVLKVIVL